MRKKTEKGVLAGLVRMSRKDEYGVTTQVAAWEKVPTEAEMKAAAKSYGGGEYVVRWQEKLPSGKSVPRREFFAVPTFTPGGHADNQRQTQVYSGPSVADIREMSGVYVDKIQIEFEKISNIIQRLDAKTDRLIDAVTALKERVDDLEDGSPDSEFSGLGGGGMGDIMQMLNSFQQMTPEQLKARIQSEGDGHG